MQSRIAPSLGDGFAGTPQEVWGTEDYTNDEDPTVFFGLYGLPDFFALWRHNGPKFILWAGSDITHFKHGYFLDEKGHIRINPEPLAKWIQENCFSYVENDVEYQELRKLGIESSIVPSFLGDVNQYNVEYKPQKKHRFYTSVSGDDFELYGWDAIEDLADEYPNVEFYLYGNKTPWYTDRPNIFVQGRVSQAQMDRETKEMTGALRLTEHDGFSEILAKSILWGQWPVSPNIDYPYVSTSIKQSLYKEEPNLWARNHYLEIINKYPWNVTNN